MDLWTLFIGFILGIIEGVTEFLPVSSTGHLILAGDLLGFNDDRAKTFEIAIQLGAILAVLWLYRDRIRENVSGLSRSRAAQGFWINLGIAFVPAAAVGLLAHKWIKAY
ncbi:MAG: undecaprenyl-diphosphatase, partial [Nitrospirae bacterium]|nr:undecaprenyl-diphosphatase [Nitrospirota bacterium]